MSVQHKDIADGQRHEPKGASSAANKTVLTANGDGTTQFAAYSFTDLTNIPASLITNVLASSSVSTAQTPSGAGVSTQIEFGPAVPTTDVSLGSDGTLTFNKAATYVVQVFLNVGRDAGTTPSVMFLRHLLNDTPTGTPIPIRLETNPARVATNLTYIISAAATDTFKMQMVVDTTGDSAGGLRFDTPATSGWTSVPTARITVNKFTNLGG